MARSTLQVLEMLECCVRRGINVHIAKQGMVLDDSIALPNYSNGFGLGSRNRAGIDCPENH
nr:hypothetical protein [Scytonema millei]